MLREEDDSRQETGRGVVYEKIQVVSVAAPKKKKKKISGGEFVYLVANRLYYSRAYTILYFSMIALNLAVLAWLILSGTHAQTKLLLCFEVLTTLTLLVEVVVKMMTQLKSYWSRASNWFDFCVLVLCVASVFIFENSSSFSEAEYVDGMMQSTLLISRYIVQILRLFMMIKQQRRMAQLTAGIGQNFAVDDVDFSILDPEIDILSNEGGYGEKRENSSQSLSSWGSVDEFNVSNVCGVEIQELHQNGELALEETGAKVEVS